MCCESVCRESVCCESVCEKVCFYVCVCVCESVCVSDFSETVPGGLFGLSSFSFEAAEHQLHTNDRGHLFRLTGRRV